MGRREWLYPESNSPLVDTALNTYLKTGISFWNESCFKKEMKMIMPKLNRAEGKVKKKNGFSFIEVLIGLSISLFILLGTAEALFHCLRVKRRVDLREKVKQLMTTEIETLRTADFQDAELQAGTSTVLIEDKISGRRYKLIKTIQLKAPGLKSIKLIAFPQDRPALRTEIIFYISQDLGFQP